MGPKAPNVKNLLIVTVDGSKCKIDKCYMEIPCEGTSYVSCITPGGMRYIFPFTNVLRISYELEGADGEAAKAKYW